MTKSISLEDDEDTYTLHCIQDAVLDWDIVADDTRQEIDDALVRLAVALRERNRCAEHAAVLEAHLIERRDGAA